MNRDFGLSPKVLDLLKEAISRFPEIEGVRVFGSRALGNYKPGSDVDLALLGPRVGDETVRKLSFLVNEELAIPYQIDLVAYEACGNPSLLEHIDTVGLPLFASP